MGVNSIRPPVSTRGVNPQGGRDARLNQCSRPAAVKDMGLQPEAPMWPLLMVVLNELLEDVFEVPLTEDEQVVEHLAAC